jgi:lysophospholipase L1-like esterase
MPHGPIRILAFGDSNTFGSAPVVAPPSRRYMGDGRWPRAMAAALGDGYEIIEEGLGGRTTDQDDFSDPFVTGANRNGLLYLPAALASHQPLDLAIIMLGTNDVKTEFGRSPERITLGMRRLVEVTLSFKSSSCDYPAPHVLVVAPPRIGNQVFQGRFSETIKDGPAKTAALPVLYAALAQDAGAHFFDANHAMATDGIDGVHFSEDSHRALGRALAEQVRRIVHAASPYPT